MYIPPNSVIHCLHNVPLDANYENTVWYSNEQEQYNDFIQYSKIHFDNTMYSSPSKGVLRVQATYAQLLDCNYLMFKNTSFENKWLYAFIYRVNYVSNEVTDIYFTIDVMQSWLKQIQFSGDKTFIAREIPTEDEVWTWQIPEDVQAGFYYLYNK